MQAGNPSQPPRSPGNRGPRPHRNQTAPGAQSWIRDAACATVDPDLFFPAERRDPAVGEAKRVCARCPVKARCLEHSLASREEFGIWGGLDEWERRALLDKQQRQHHGIQGVA